MCVNKEGRKQVEEGKDGLTSVRFEGRRKERQREKIRKYKERRSEVREIIKAPVVLWLNVNLFDKELTAQDRHSLVCCVEAAVGHSLISHKHHRHVGAGGGQVRGEGGATKPETKSCF